MMTRLKMTRTKWVVTLLLAVSVLSAPFMRSKASNHHRSQEQKAPATLPPLIADGSVDPDKIPDMIAFEILLKSVEVRSIADGVGDSELERLRAKVLAEKTNLPADKIEILIATANNFKDSIKILDAQAMDVKDRQWPKSNQAAINQLSGLQKKKDTQLRQAYLSLLSQLTPEDKAKLFSRLREIKKGVRAFQGVPTEAYQK